MSNGDILRAESDQRYHRPLGVWALTVGNVVFVGLIFLTVLEVIIYPDENWNSVSRIAAPYLLLLTIVIAISSMGAWFGNAYARTAMLASLSILTAVTIWESIAVISSLAPFVAKVSDVSWLGLWKASMGVRWVLWLAINYWYFLGSQAGDFYSSR